ncbi:WD repeat and HMG-box DNA-binding protein 1 [Heteronotia binoei]|uniref:WD repeat and HMG-box DNA-binding protein 1 n=1 Tax=Heteronotia binoei TaxID=13085 RepID=UPI00292F88EC|nr:WD repeat and HMG-box DNA-binding protein 1 [Heteronotia binoei]
MPLYQKPMRYGHTEGHTDVCFNDAGSCIITCGSDGDVRIWEGLDDDDPKSINVGEKAYSFALMNGRLITAVSNNTLQIHTFPDGVPDGVLTRFTMNANHVTFNADGTKVAAGSSDFLVKIVEVADSSQQKTFRGHDAPVLSVSFDPQGAFLASASCDGSVRVWNIAEQICEKSWPLLQKCNDVVDAKSICRLAWQPKKGKFLAIPVEKVVKMYKRETWNHEFDLSDNFISQTLSVVAWSPCGQFVAAGSVGGCMIIWNVDTKECLERVKHEKSYTICGLAWHPGGSQVAYTDTEGNLGLLENVCSADGKPSNAKVSDPASKDYDDLFDGDDSEDFLNRDFVEPQSSPKAETNYDDEEDDLTVTSGRPRNRGAIIEDDENSIDLGLLKAESAPNKPDEEDDRESLSLVLPQPSTQRPFYDGPMPTSRQKPFQSGSTPVHLTHRFMVWNSVGIIRCYNDEQDNAIEVEFHDAAVHHAMHLPNSLSHTMADLSIEAVLLACESTEELASKLHCIHFNSWDSNKEWTVDMLQDEDIQAVCLGQGWAACATSALLIRVFTVGGVQKEIFSLPGPVVSMAGHGEQLLVVFHRGTGFDGDQCLGVQLVELGKKKRQILHGVPLPLSWKSYLTWVGFSAEGTPSYADSEGIVRMLNRGLDNTWTPVCNTREHSKGKSDHCWIVGIHERPQQLRCIPCKGARFPPTLPRPAVAVLPFKLPFCQAATDKGQMEEQFWRSVLFHNYLEYLSRNGYECDESEKGQAVQEQQNLLMKMFALSCTLEREFRCMELAELMTQNAVSLAIKYASRSRKLNLAQKLSELAAEKSAELAAADELGKEEEEEDFRSDLNAGYSNTPTEWSQSKAKSLQRQQSTEASSEVEEDEEDVSEEAKPSETRTLIQGSPAQCRNSTTPKPAVIVSSSQGRVNPFKVSSSQKDPIAHSTNILDNMSKLPKKNPTSVRRTVPSKEKGPVIKPLVPKPKSRQAAAAAFFQPRSSEKKTTEEKAEKTEAVPTETQAPTEDGENRRPKTGFQMWLEENRSLILADNPNFEESEIIREGMGRFRTLSPEERMAWTERAKGRESGDSGERKKRKHPEGVNSDGQESPEQESKENNNSAKKPKPAGQVGCLKLSAFVFKQT